MSRKVRQTAILLAILVTITAVPGCGRPGTAVGAGTDAPTSENIGFFDFSAELVPLAATPITFTIPMPTAPGKQVSTNRTSTIDFSNACEGYVMIRVLKSTAQQLRVRIVGPSEVIYQYRLDQNGQWEVFPLSDGNGSYTIAVWEQIEGSRFAQINSVTFDVALRDEFAPFLRPNQFVNFSKDSSVVSKATELTRGLKEAYPRVEAIYNFVINNITYDRVFAEEVQQGMHSGYVPDVDAVLARGKGICFDYAALMTAMLRSLGIPTRLVIGYAGEQLHAWIDVYSDAEGWINNIIHFDGNDWNLMDPTFAATGSQSTEVMRFIGDGTNYSPRFLH
ncbi:MAG: transglutaminase-like domain-containing protein [Oscillospiraceae bacterium]|nr:transglutaminase-like domain-containing protein [Oscillospiraceae bacterium]